MCLPVAQLVEPQVVGSSPTRWCAAGGAKSLLQVQTLPPFKLSRTELRQGGPGE